MSLQQKTANTSNVSPKAKDGSKRVSQGAARQNRWVDFAESDLHLTPSNARVLHRTLGNRAVGRMIQAKLKIGQPNDKFEQEADSVADQVMRMPEPVVRREEEDETVRKKCAACEKGGALCPSCAAEEKIQRKPLAPTITSIVQRENDEDEKTLRCKSASSPAPTVTPKASANINAMRGGGQPLPPAARTFFEPRFGADFSNVRIHRDNRAAETAQAVNAKAFTIGRDVAFGSGQYAPETSAGKKLLAHELTHVVQQNDRVAQRESYGSKIQLDASETTIQRAEGDSESIGDFFRRVGRRIANFFRGLIDRIRGVRGRSPETRRDLEEGAGLIANQGGFSEQEEAMAPEALTQAPHPRRSGKGKEEEFDAESESGGSERSESPPLMERLGRREKGKGKAGPERAASASESLEKVGAAEAERFTQTYNKQCVPLEASAEVLIISEAESAKERLGAAKFAEQQVTTTFYGEPPEQTKNVVESAQWDWIATECPFAGKFYDVVVARSMICLCEDRCLEHLGDGGVEVKETCGGVKPDDRVNILNMVARLLKPHSNAKAFLTNSIAGVSPLNKKYALAYWEPALQAFNSGNKEFVAKLIFKGDPRSENFGIVITRRSD